MSVVSVGQNVTTTQRREADLLSASRRTENRLSVTTDSTVCNLFLPGKPWLLAIFIKSINVFYQIPYQRMIVSVRSSQLACQNWLFSRNHLPDWAISRLLTLFLI